MKKAMIALAIGAMTLMAQAKGVEQVSIVENEIATINVPFGITSYLPSNMDVVRIEEVSGTSLRITALRRGRCDLDVRGDKDLSQKYEIVVLGDLATTLDTLNIELDQVQEVRARVVGDFIRIDGEISSIQKWEYLQKVLRNYPDVVRNFAVFSPGPDVMLRLQETLQEAGFTVVFQSLGKDRKAWPANQVSLVLNKNTKIMTIQGRVHSPEMEKKVRDCLSTERWLTLELKPSEERGDIDEFRIRGQFDLYVDRPQIRLSLAYMAIGDSDIKKLGNESALNRDGVLNISGTLSTLASIVRGKGAEISRDWSSGAGGGASLNVLANFLKKNGITKISETGYTVIESWNPDGASFKSGGTMFVRTIQPGGGVIGNANMEKIPYGFILNTVGGISDDGEFADLMVDFTLSSVTQVDEMSYDRKEETTKQRLKLPLGRTTFLGGRSMVEDNRTSPSGLPILRNTPLLNWFVADSGTELNDKKLVIMVCPEIVDNTRDEKIDVDKEINIPVPVETAKTTEEREEERRPYSGGLWNPLNWFVF